MLNTNNFNIACDQVSENAYTDNYKRLKLIFEPTCAYDLHCKHKKNDKSKNKVIQEMPARSENCFNMVLMGNMWLDALDICFISVTSKMYLTANVLKNIVNIMLDAHEGCMSPKGYLTQLLRRCKQLLALQFHYHPPCANHSKIIDIYNDFLFGSMPLRKKKFSNNNYFESDKGIVQYCFNRLENEVFNVQDDGPLLTKADKIPESMKQTTKELHFEREELEIYEFLKRSDRIDRLMSVLHSIIELLQFDLLITKSRYRPMLFQLIKLKEENKIIQQISKLFIYFIHLKYPERHIKTLGLWLNIATETFYRLLPESQFDYPRLISSYWRPFVKNIFLMMQELPEKSVFNIFERIEPNYLKYMVGRFYTSWLLDIEEDNVIQIIITFLENEQWKNFDGKTSEKVTDKDKQAVNPKNIINVLSEICKTTVYFENQGYPLYTKQEYNDKISLNIVINAMYVTLMAYLDLYNIQNVKKTYEKLQQNETNNNNDLQIKSPYMASHITAKTYRDNYKLLNELISILKNLNQNGLPGELNVFKEILDLDLSPVYT